jgi:hypothetical protein
MDPNNSHPDWSILEKPRLPRRHNEIERAKTSKPIVVHVIYY